MGVRQETRCINHSYTEILIYKETLHNACTCKLIKKKLHYTHLLSAQFKDKQFHDLGILEKFTMSFTNPNYIQIIRLKKIQ